MSIGASQRVGWTPLVMSLAQGSLPPSFLSASVQPPPQPRAASTSNTVIISQSLHCDAQETCYSQQLVLTCAPRQLLPSCLTMTMPHLSLTGCTGQNEVPCHESVTCTHCFAADWLLLHYAVKLSGLCPRGAATASACKARTVPG